MASELTWLGHGSWSIALGGHAILLDPFLDDSPTAPVKAERVGADFILLSLPEGNVYFACDAGQWAGRVRAETEAEPIVLEPGGKIGL